MREPQPHAQADHPYYPGRCASSEYGPAHHPGQERVAYSPRGSRPTAAEPMSIISDPAVLLLDPPHRRSPQAPSTSLPTNAGIETSRHSRRATVFPAEHTRQRTCATSSSATPKRRPSSPPSAALTHSGTCQPAVRTHVYARDVREIRATPLCTIAQMRRCTEHGMTRARPSSARTEAPPEGRSAEC